MKTAIFPGSFDPITNGHIDIIKRASAIFDKVIVLIAINPNKKSYFSLEEKLLIAKDAVKEFSNVIVDACDGYTVDYAKKHGTDCLIRGLRDREDLLYEIKLENAYKEMNPDIKVLYFISDKDTISIHSSNIVKDIINNKDIRDLVPDSVIEVIKKRK